MATSIDTRISRLLDQLEDPSLSDSQIERLKDRLEVLQSEKGSKS